jgi:uncharacterized protein (DUF924 family)
VTPDSILQFWFAEGPDTPREVWFRKNPDFDASIRDAFAPLLAPAREGALDDWAATPHGALALLVVLDQFPRNLHRGEAAAFASDGHARAIAARLLAGQQDLLLTPTQRVFAYLPFEHSEAMADQDLSVALFGGLRDRPAMARPGGAIAYAWAHRAVIAQFGRFPHRNPALGRASTPAELVYLAQPGAGF